MTTLTLIALAEIWLARVQQSLAVAQSCALADPVAARRAMAVGQTYLVCVGHLADLIEAS